MDVDGAWRRPRARRACAVAVRPKDVRVKIGRGAPTGELEGRSWERVREAAEESRGEGARYSRGDLWWVAGNPRRHRWRELTKVWRARRPHR